MAFVTSSAIALRQSCTFAAGDAYRHSSACPQLAAPTHLFQGSSKHARPLVHTNLVTASTPTYSPPGPGNQLTVFFADGYCQPYPSCPHTLLLNTRAQLPTDTHAIQKTDRETDRPTDRQTDHLCPSHIHCTKSPTYATLPTPHSHLKPAPNHLVGAPTLPPLPSPSSYLHPPLSFRHLLSPPP